MVGIFYRGILNTKLINHKAKYGASIVMYSKTRCVLYGMIPTWIHIFHQFLISYDTGFFESIYSIFDTHVDPPLVVYNCSEVVRTNDLLWDDSQWNAHEFQVW